MGGVIGKAGEEILLTKKELMADIESKFGKRSLLRKKQISEYTGYNNRELNELTRGLSNFGNDGKGQRYHTMDLVDAIHQKQRMG